MDHFSSGSGARWCARADAMFDVPRMHVLAVPVDGKDRLVLTWTSTRSSTAAQAAECWRSATAAGSTLSTTRTMSWPSHGGALADTGLRCRELCPTATFSEAHDLAPPRAVLTTRAVAWAADALTHDDTTVSALARHLGGLARLGRHRG